jgi:hypothetical protein
MGWMARIRFLAGVRDFTLLRSIQISSGSQLVSYPMGTGTLFWKVMRLGCLADHLSVSSAEVKSDGTLPPLHHMSSWCGVKLSAGTPLPLPLRGTAVALIVGLPYWLILRVG